jgi:hypothetical protein
MMTALYAARNILGATHDLWAVNTEPEYHEEKQESRKEAPAPERRRPAYAEPTLIPRPVNKLHPTNTPLVTRSSRAKAASAS